MQLTRRDHSIAISHLTVILREIVNELSVCGDFMNVLVITWNRRDRHTANVFKKHAC